MKFYSAFAPAPSVAEPQCPVELQDYEYNKSTRQLVPTKKIEFYKEIQSYYESTRIDVKLKKYSMGDFSALGCPGGAYGDFTDIPTNLAQVLNAKETAQQSFFKLPSAVRELFNNDFTEFIKCVENGTYEQRLVDFASRGVSDGGASDGGASDGGTSAPNSNNGGNN